MPQESWAECVASLEKHKIKGQATWSLISTSGL